ncbi:hypothetical protein KGQ71_02775, partial [Patescibacteria group bacterium]|nr:hypothetical protein [Patescibacteria group bacterium]
MDSQSDNTIKAGLRFLSGQQQPNGGFLSSSTSNPTDFEGAAIFHTGFFPGLILAALATLPEKSMKNRLAAFLIGQKSPDWSWNYWQRDSQEYRQLPYPDDLDDTFSALTALFSFQPELIDGNALARIIRLLTAVESRAGGPYRTWLVTADADPVWRDIDLAVNAQIDGFLATQEVQLPALTNFLDSAIRSGKVTSPYYPTPYPIFYYLSRHYRGTEKTALIAALLKRQPHTALDAALRLTSLLRLGRPANTLRKQADLLYQAQQKDGSWPAAPFCFDPSRDGRKTYAGSAALSTALCLEALSLWKQAAKPLAARPSIADRIEKTVYQEIRKRAENRLDALPAGALPTQTRTALTAVIHDNRDRQVLLLPFTFRKMLGQRGQQISDELVIGLGLANLWGWLAYSIFDDFIDDEGHPERLPSASLALRECLSLFFSLPLPTGFLPYLATTFDRIETANAAEVA